MLQSPRLLLWCRLGPGTSPDICRDGQAKYFSEPGYVLRKPEAGSPSTCQKEYFMYHPSTQKYCPIKHFRDKDKKFSLINSSNSLKLDIWTAVRFVWCLLLTLDVLCHWSLLLCLIHHIETGQESPWSLLDSFCPCCFLHLNDPLTFFVWGCQLGWGSMEHNVVSIFSLLQHLRPLSARPGHSPALN